MLLAGSAASGLSSPLCDICWFRDCDERELYRRGVPKVEKKTGRSFGAVACLTSDHSAGSIPQNHDSAPIRPSLQSSYRIKQSGDTSVELKQQVTTDAAKELRRTQVGFLVTFVACATRNCFISPTAHTVYDFTHADAESRTRHLFCLQQTYCSFPREDSSLVSANLFGRIGSPPDIRCCSGSWV